jgi:hypothetical protein
MFARGSSTGQEFRRDELAFYKGIVVKNNDPLRLNRIKVYIPELTNQPFEEWFADNEDFKIKVPGINNIGDNWIDTDIYEAICKTIPWAEPCYPVIGESGSSRYVRDEKISSISDSNYISGLSAINDTPPTLDDGGFSPAFLFENAGTSIGDGFGDPTVNFAVNCNPYSFSYKPSKHVNKAKGLFGIPEVGANVWVFFWQGSTQFPVYFGVSRNYRELTLINNTDNEKKLSPTYPIDFES